jgi:hypothetical protein
MRGTGKDKAHEHNIRKREELGKERKIKLEE